MLYILHDRTRHVTATSISRYNIMYAIMAINVAIIEYLKFWTLFSSTAMLNQMVNSTHPISIYERTTVMPCQLLPADEWDETRLLFAIFFPIYSTYGRWLSTSNDCATTGRPLRGCNENINILAACKDSSLSFSLVSLQLAASAAARSEMPFIQSTSHPVIGTRNAGSYDDQWSAC